MTRQEAAGFVGIVIRAYPNSDKFATKEAVNETVNLWSTMFADDDSAVVALAIKTHIATSKWPPSIAEIRERMVTIQHPELIPPDQAWEAVADRKATEGDWGYTESPADALPPMIARTVQTIGWYDLWKREEKARQTFLELYRPAYERERERAMLPKALSDASRIAAEKADRLHGGALLMLESAKERREEAERKDKEYWDEWRNQHETVT